MTNVRRCAVAWFVLLILVFGNACSHSTADHVADTTASVTDSVRTDGDTTASVTDSAHTEASTIEENTDSDVLQNDVEGFFRVSWESDGELSDELRAMKSTVYAGIDTDVHRVTDEACLGRTIEFANDTFLYQSTEKSLMTTKKGEYGTFYSSYDIYENDTGDEVRFLSGTDYMTFYFDGGRSNVNTHPEDLTAEEATAIANEFLSSILPQEILDDIPWVSTAKANYSERTYDVIYFRKLHGYYTDESIMVMVDVYSREVFAYNGECVGKYADLASTITQESLDRAYAVLKNKVESMNLHGTEVIDACVMTNTVGDVYMAMTFEYTTSDTGETRVMQEIVTKVEIP